MEFHRRTRERRLVQKVVNKSIQLRHPRNQIVVSMTDHIVYGNCRIIRNMKQSS